MSDLAGSDASPGEPAAAAPVVAGPLPESDFLGTCATYGALKVSSWGGAGISPMPRRLPEVGQATI